MDLDKLRRVCAEHKYGYRVTGESPRLVLVGEAHKDSFLDAQEQIIETVLPRVILHEAADPELLWCEETERILGWGEKYGIPIDLCDVPNKNSQNPKVSKNALEDTIGRVLKDFEFSGDYQAHVDMVGPLREMYMAKIIQSYIDKSSLPLVAVVGAKHVMPRSKIHDALESRGTSYLTIVQQREVLQSLRQDADFFETH